jgi:hypothetical protein
MFRAWLMGVGAYHVSAGHRLSDRAGWILLWLPLTLLATYQLLPHSPLQQFAGFSFAAERLETKAQDHFISAFFSAHLFVHTS